MMQSQSDQIIGVDSTGPPNEQKDANATTSLAQIISPQLSSPNSISVNEDETFHVPTLPPDVSQNQHKEQNSTKNSCPLQNDIKNALALTKITAMTADPVNDSAKGNEHMNCSWYNAYLQMQRRQHEIALGVDNQDEIKEINQMLTHYSLVDLRQKLFLVQKQLCLYHTMIEKYEECKAQRDKLEEKNKKVVSDRKKYEDHMKKSRAMNKKLKKELLEKDSQLVDLKMELAETKVLLAQARSSEDHQKFRVMKITEQKDKLEEENMSLRRTNSMHCLANQDSEQDVNSTTSKGRREGGMRRICSMLSIPQPQDRQLAGHNSLPLPPSQEVEPSSDPNSDTEGSLDRTSSADESHNTNGENITSQNEQDVDDGPNPADSSPHMGNKFWNISTLFNTSHRSLGEGPTRDVTDKNCHDKLPEDMKTKIKKRPGQKWEESRVLLITAQDSFQLE